jgi:hypothetical protein
LVERSVQDVAVAVVFVCLRFIQFGVVLTYQAVQTVVTVAGNEFIILADFFDVAFRIVVNL